MSSPRIINIINFLRGIEPRYPVDLIEPVREQLKLVNRFDLPTTWLLQHDALLDEKMMAVLRDGLRPHHEVGAWLEIVQPTCERAGIAWRGRFPWDWHANVGFTVGYTPRERERLVDAVFQDFYAKWRFFPSSVGAWCLDAHTLNYLNERYGVVAACICKDQIGTDGYTLWGGPWSGGYYPSRLNALVPAQEASAQIPIPVFRMLGSDPIYQYDHGLGGGCQGVISLEPVYSESGGDPAWIRWFFDVLQAPSLAFSYAQAGQENSFGWPAMRDGLTDQIELLAQQHSKGKVRVETLQTTGQWFREQFATTPMQATTALSDWQIQGRRSVWFHSRFYRANAFWDESGFRLRDLHVFDQRYPERYLNDVTTSPLCTFDALPLVDGFNHSTPDQLAGLLLLKNGEICVGNSVSVEENGDGLVMRWHAEGLGAAMLIFSQEELEITVETTKKWTVEWQWGSQKITALTRVMSQRLDFEYDNFSYALCLKAGIARHGENKVKFEPKENVVRFSFRQSII